MLPPVNASSFEINPTIIMMIKTSYQFGGHPHEDPYAYIVDFLELCATFKINGASDDAVYLRLFPFSLKGNVKRWLHNLAASSIRTWKDMANQFLFKYYPVAKTLNIRAEVLNFSQGDNETLYEVWDRFKDLLRRCPHHDVSDSVILETFYSGLLLMTKLRVRVAAGGSFLAKTPEELYGLIEDQARNEDH
ncbi:uncharacterized protein LOC129319333 [Prosopis cineraria]|uniref:uncharacterized protein LOC129319333 n=1 Tax=Prosopis cineraria TaxID=364024 RepID=UPI00240F0D55|nr:uncharacterized protein LOC129319333 [Prosopis cineraria]XP_054820342.1 uncharacterized protein LOC129319333 [Prosopis cineraria]